jgi:hypothetical protein
MPTTMGVRTAVMASLEAGKWALDAKIGKRVGIVRKMREFGVMLLYGMKYGMTHRNKVKPMTNIDNLVDRWIEAIVGMCLAHDKDAYDAKDAEADTLLGPLLTAPVKQVRAFYLKLRDKMRADKRVPWLVVMGYEVWGKGLVEDAPDEGVKRLKNKLAGEIAELVELEIRDQIPEAIKRALRWRDPETLQAVKETLERGVKPKLRGRESCLFLEAGRGKKKVSVML